MGFLQQGVRCCGLLQQGEERGLRGCHGCGPLGSDGQAAKRGRDQSLRTTPASTRVGATLRWPLQSRNRRTRTSPLHPAHEVVKPFLHHRTPRLIIRGGVSGLTPRLELRPHEDGFPPAEAVEAVRPRSLSHRHHDGATHLGKVDGEPRMVRGEQLLIRTERLRGALLRACTPGGTG